MLATEKAFRCHQVHKGILFNNKYDLRTFRICMCVCGQGDLPGDILDDGNAQSLFSWISTSQRSLSALAEVICLVAVLWGTMIPSITHLSSFFLQGMFIYSSNSKDINIFPHVPTNLWLHHPHSSLCLSLASGVSWTWHILMFLVKCTYVSLECRHNYYLCW